MLSSMLLPNTFAEDIESAEETSDVTEETTENAAEATDEEVTDEVSSLFLLLSSLLLLLLLLPSFAAAPPVSTSRTDRTARRSSIARTARTLSSRTSSATEHGCGGVHIRHVARQSNGAVSATDPSSGRVKYPSDTSVFAAVTVYSPVHPAPAVVETYTTDRSDERASPCAASSTVRAPGRYTSGRRSV